MKFLVTIPLHFGGRRRPPIVIERTSKEWGRLDPSYCRAGPGTSETSVTIPRDMFCDCRAVEDAWGYVVPLAGPVEDYLDTAAHRTLPTVMLVAESPHRAEYDEGDAVAGENTPICGHSTGVFRPLAPLNGARPRVTANLGDILRGDPRLAPYLPCRVRLCNPIQFQTSLARFVLPHRSGRARGLQAAVRNAVWGALWDAFEDDGHGGRRAFLQEAFIERVEEFGPVLVLIASTSKLREKVAKLAERCGWRYALLNHHPSVWRRGNSPTKVTKFYPGL